MPTTAWTLSKSACLALFSAYSCVLTIPAQSEELISYKIANEAISQSLTGKEGDPANGRKVVIDSKRGGCLSCHQIPIPEEQFHGEVGPNLEGVASRLTEGQLRLRLVDAKQIIPNSFMPAFYKITSLHRVQKKYEGKPILTAQEVEDVIAYLKTLKAEKDPKAQAAK